MVKSRYRKLKGMHAGHVYVVTAPASEMDSSMHWTLQCETVPDERLTVGEDELSDRAQWEPLG